MSTKNRTNFKAPTITLPRKALSPKDFSWTSWKPHNFKDIVDTAIEELKNDYHTIKKIPPQLRTFDNTIVALERCGKEYGQKIHYVGFLAEVSPDKSVRDAAHRVEEEYSKKIVDVVYDEGMYIAVKEYASKKERLTGDAKILLNDTLRGYQRMGFDLPKDTQKILKNNLKKLSKLTLEFKKNINEYKDFITLTNEEAVGLSERYLQGLTKDKDGKYIVTLEYPDIGPFLENSPNDHKRKEITDKNARKGGQRNITLLQEMLALRNANAKLLGYKTFAHFVIEDRMAKTPETVMKFLHNTVTKIKKGAKKDREEILEFKRTFTENPKASFEYYDSYYVNQLQKKKYSVDNEKIREYFPFTAVRDGVFGIYQKLLGVTFERVTRFPLWHKDVELYAIKDKGNIIAYFATDLFPREGKYGHAAAFDLVKGRQEGDHYVAPCAALVCNFPKPTKNNPSLLSHDEVETFFHEFGHIMHEVLTTAQFESQSGFNVAWDYVEMPSQMLENWVWKKEVLKKISSHYKTHEQLPNDLIQKMLKAEKFRISTMYLRQMLLALFDMKLHFENAEGAPQEIYRHMVHEMLGHTLPTTQLFPAGFGHIGGGYAAGYYSYAWAKVYAQDMFTRFENEGLFNSKTGRAYRTWILEKGSSMEEMDLIKGFLGRKPNNKAFLKYIGAE